VFSPGSVAWMTGTGAGHDDGRVLQCRAQLDSHGWVASMNDDKVQHLFSYGTLRQSDVQQALFGRILAGTPDSLPGFELGMLQITDPAVIATSGSDRHPILRRVDDASSEVAGLALEVTPQDLAAADAYEVGDYARRIVTLKSGLQAYVYLDASQP
jgi:hypothetical protein